MIFLWSVLNISVIVALSIGTRSIHATFDQVIKQFISFRQSKNFENIVLI